MEKLNERHVGFSHVAITTNTNKSFNCNQITLVNKGSVNVLIGDNFILGPEQSVTYRGWPGEIIITVFNITFAARANGCLLIAICKNYV